MKAVVTTDADKYSVEEVILDGPKAGEVKVKIGACGVCHSDLSVITGKLPLPKPLVPRTRGGRGHRRTRRRRHRLRGRRSRGPELRSGLR